MLPILPGISSISNLEDVKETCSEVAPLEPQVVKQVEKLLLILTLAFPDHLL
jgi:hypothetical protein